MNTAKLKHSMDIHIYQMKVTLEDSKPPIWRRIQVPSTVTLYRLHMILQVAMGWSNYHLHEFNIDGGHYGEPSPDNAYKVRNEKTVKLSQVVSKEGAKFAYIYDFGDYWYHKTWLKRFCHQNQINTILFVLKAKVPALLKIAAEFGAITIFLRQFKILVFQSTINCWSGWTEVMIPKLLILMISTKR